MTPTQKAEQAAGDIISAFSNAAAIDTARADLCAFIFAAAELALDDPEVAREIGRIMAGDEGGEERSGRGRVRITLQLTVPPEQSRPPRPDEIWENADPDAGLTAPVGEGWVAVRDALPAIPEPYYFGKTSEACDVTNGTRTGSAVYREADSVLADDGDELWHRSGWVDEDFEPLDWTPTHWRPETRL